MKMVYLSMRSKRLATFGLVGLVWSANGVCGETDAVPAPAKKHVLFVGADLAVEQKKEYYEVQDVTTDEVLFKREGKLSKVRIKPDLPLQITEKIKISDTNLRLEGVAVERAYTMAADPNIKFAHQAAIAAGASAVQDVANVKAAQASITAQNAHAAAAAVPQGPANDPVARALFDATRAEYNATAAAADSVAASAFNDQVAVSDDLAMHPTDIGNLAGQMSNELAQEMFDAIRVTFDVVADRDISKPYYVMIVQVKDPRSKPGEVRRWVYVKTLGPLTAGERRQVKIYQGGFPPGYTLLRWDVHFYVNGREMATNASRKRVELSEDEYQQFIIVDYIKANKGKTLAAEPANRLQKSLRERLAPGQLSETYFVKVGKSGAVTGTYRDSAGEVSLNDEPLETALKSLRFKPALESGKAIETIVAIQLGRWM